MLAVINFLYFFNHCTIDMPFQAKPHVGMIHLNAAHEAQHSGKDKNTGF